MYLSPQTSSVFRAKFIAYALMVGMSILVSAYLSKGMWAHAQAPLQDLPQDPPKNLPKDQGQNQAATANAAKAANQAIKIELNAQSPLLKTPRPEVIARETNASYLSDFLAPEARILLKTSSDTAVYDNSQANFALDSLKQGKEVELLGFTQHGLLVRAAAPGRQGYVTGWIGKAAAKNLQPELLKRLAQMQQRRDLVEKLIKNREVALGMTPAEVKKALGRPDQESLKETTAGVNGVYSWVETRNIPIYETLRDPYSGQLYRRIIDYDVIETSRTDIEFERGLVKAIERNKDRRRASSLPPRVLPPVPLCW